MVNQSANEETVPEAVPADAQPPRRVLKAGPVAVGVWSKMRQAAIADAEQREREREAAETIATERALEQAANAAGRKNEEAERDGERGALHVARDGLAWLYRKGKLIRPHYEAGLRFRKDFELSNGSAMVSCLALEAGCGFGPKAGATDRQIRAHANVQAALSVAALGSPLLRPYVVYVAGMGEMLSGDKFGGSRQKADAHLHPCVIALDALARHYGLIR